MSDFDDDDDDADDSSRVDDDDDEERQVCERRRRRRRKVQRRLNDDTSKKPTFLRTFSSAHLKTDPSRSLTNEESVGVGSSSEEAASHSPTTLINPTLIQNPVN